LLARIESDVIPFKPTVATTSYGMNDGTYASMSQTIGDNYRQALTASIDKLKANGVRTIIAGSPGCVDSKMFGKPNLTADEYNKTLDALRGITQEVAQKEGVGYADVHTPMMQVMAKAKAAYGDDYPFVAGGGVHPGNNGHIVMAYAYLKALGCDGAIGTITVDLGTGKAEGTPGQKIVSYQNGTIEIESTRYPFCFQGAPGTADQSTGSVLGFFPFNDELNRYLLIVKGIKRPKVKVTWGTTTKEYSADDLAKGVNLAADFLVNPFSDQFAKVNAAVQTQQADETTLVKNFLHNVASFKIMAPHSAVELDKTSADAVAQEKALSGAAAALVTPVRHAIKIEPEA
jgi:hypothetical protein